jgi:hypothetical protein
MLQGSLYLLSVEPDVACECVPAGHNSIRVLKMQAKTQLIIPIVHVIRFWVIEIHGSGRSAFTCDFETAGF